MKAKIKATGEIVEIVSYGVYGSYTNYVDKTGKFCQTTLNYYTDFEQIDCIDWEKRKYKIAMGMLPMVSQLCDVNSNGGLSVRTPERAAECAVSYADALINELKKSSKQ